MKQKIFQIMISSLLIITLTMANFVLLCADVVTYATDAINADKSTNHRNVEFMAYFKDSGGNKITDLDSYANSNDLRLYFQISVKQEGYFNGNIILNDANFKFKSDVISDGVNKIEDNAIYLNQINAGETKEIEVAIELIKDDKFDLSFINKNSVVSIDGIYRDSTEKDIAIKTSRNITLNFVCPYINSDESMVLNQNVITNKVVNYNGEDKKVIQVKVESGINDNLFPIKKSSINIQVPKISNKYPESVLVNSNDILVTNGKVLAQDNWSYNNETGLITINVENNVEDNKVSWIKSGNDKFIITYIYDKSVEIGQEKLIMNSEIELYDLKDTKMKKTVENSLINEQKDAIATSNIVQNEPSIFKGKLYAGIARDITYKNIINVNLNNVASLINVDENNQTINNENVNSTYKTTKINKANLDSVLGESGNLNILNAIDGSIISTININCNADESGNIVITYPENIKTIRIQLEKVKNIGKLVVENTKNINSVSRSIVKEASNINQKVTVSYISNNSENKLEGFESNIELKETETSADLQINRKELSAMTPNNGVEFRVILKSKDEQNELFRNPVIKLELPEKIQDIQINSVNLVDEDELKIKSQTLNGKTLEIVLEGQQTRYKSEAVEGAMIIINANLTTSTKLTNSTEQVKLTYTNDMAVNYKDGANFGTVINNIDIVSYAGVVTTNEISAYGIDVVNNRGVRAAELAVSSDTKTVQINKRIINNNDAKITTAKILGTFPTKEAISTNTIDIEVGNISVSGIDSQNVKIYYSDNENATVDLDNKDNRWSESITNSKNVKKYLVIVNGLDVKQEIDLTYSITIPANLEYNESAEEGYNVYYQTETAPEEKIDSGNIKISTPKGAVLETTLKGIVGGVESNKVKEYEVLRYAITVTNTGSEDISNVKITAKVPEGTTFVNSDMLDNEIYLEDLKFEDETKKDIEIPIEHLAKGETVTKFYEVKINQGMKGKEISNSVTINYGEITKDSNEVKTLIEEGKLEQQLMSIDAREKVLKSGYPYRYLVRISNKTDEEMKDVKVIVNSKNLQTASMISYCNSENMNVKTEKQNDIVIDKIPAKGNVDVSIIFEIPEYEDNNLRDTSVFIKSLANNKDYYSNEVNVLARRTSKVDMTMTSENSGQYVKPGDTIKYKINIKNNGNDAANTVAVRNYLSNVVTLSKIIKNGKELDKDSYNVITDNLTNRKEVEIKESSLNTGDSIEYDIYAKVNTGYVNDKVEEIVNEAKLFVNNAEITTLKVEHILQPEESNPGDNGDNGDNGGNSGSNSGENGNGSENESGNNQETTNNYRIISGSAWLDANEDGQKDANEAAIEGINVKLLDAKTSEFVKDSDGKELSATTNTTGFYSFDKVKNGEYIVIFDYDTSKYNLTTFKKSGISEDLNSNVINKTIKIGNENKKVASTEILNVNDKNIANINIGLVKAKNFDLQLDKYISKVAVHNKKTVSNSYDSMTLVKQEIDAKQVTSTTVVVEYNIRVTNKGDVAGYVKKIADYLSSDFKFNSELNKDWYQKDNVLYCTSLANEKIEPGESKEVKLVVVKQMKENNTGLVNNTAEIVESYNEQGLEDTNSKEGNKVKGENDMGSADLIISIRTGQVVMTVTLSIIAIAMLAIAVFFIRKAIINRRVI